MFSALSSFFQRIFTSLFANPERQYLEQSTDLADLERRMRRLERRGTGFPS